MTERRKMTDDEAAAVLTLVRGGWLSLELTLDGPPVNVTVACPHDHRKPVVANGLTARLP